MDGALCKKTWNGGEWKETMANSLPPWGLSLPPPWNQAAEYIYVLCGWPLTAQPSGNTSPISATRQFTVVFRHPTSSAPCQHVYFLDHCGHTGMLQGQNVEIKEIWSIFAMFSTKILRKIHPPCTSPKHRSHP